MRLFMADQRLTAIRASLEAALNAAAPPVPTSGSGPSTFEEIPHLGEEPLMIRAVPGVLAGLGLELLEQFPLPGTQVLRRFDGDLNEHVATLIAAQHRKTLAA